MEKAKRARKAETPKRPSLSLRSRAPYLYPDRAYSACAGVPDVYGPAIGCHHYGERFGAHRNRWKGRVGGRADWGHRVKYAIRNIDGLPVGRDDDRLRSSSDHDRRVGRIVR